MLFNSVKLSSSFVKSRSAALLQTGFIHGAWHNFGCPPVCSLSNWWITLAWLHCAWPRAVRWEPYASLDKAGSLDFWHPMLNCQNMICEISHNLISNHWRCLSPKRLSCKTPNRITHWNFWQFYFSLLSQITPSMMCAGKPISCTMPQNICAAKKQSFRLTFHFIPLQLALENATGSSDEFCG